MVEQQVSLEFSQGDSDADAPGGLTLREAEGEVASGDLGDGEVVGGHANSQTDEASSDEAIDIDDDEELSIDWMPPGTPVGPPEGALRADRERNALAWKLSILFHVLLVAGIVLFFDRFVEPRLRLAKGTGSVSGPPGAADADALPGPILPAPDISSEQSEAAFPPPPSESAEALPLEFAAAPLPLPPSLPVPEPPPSFGVGPSPDIPLPHFASRPLPAGKAAAATPVSPVPATAPAGPPRVVAAAGRPGGQAFKPPRPTGGGGGGVLGDPDGIDERGLPIPEYPAQSRRRHEEGLVEVNVQVLPDGTVGAVRVITDPGFPRLVESAVAAAKRARFEPALRDGQPVIATLIVPYRFILK